MKVKEFRHWDGVGMSPKESNRQYTFALNFSLNT